MTEGNVTIIPPESIAPRKAKISKNVAIDSIFEVFGHPANKAEFKRRLADEAATDILKFYKEFVLPIQPKEAKLELEGGLNFSEIKMLLGDAIVRSAVATPADQRKLEEINQKYAEQPPADEDYDDKEVDELELRAKKAFLDGSKP